VPTLGDPGAARFAFRMSAVACHALAVWKANLRVAHGAEVAAEVSDSARVEEVAEVDPGRMVAVPPARWPRLARRSVVTVAGLLNALAERVPVDRRFRCRRGPKKAQPRRRSGKRIHHISNKKLLVRARGPRAPARGGRNLTTSRT
jgi:hypothetical protein